ncbi:hypothetical protein KY290_006927 [Solanum tuberosum]|uniref:Uncharacterized protein n=1 Tax=Solanum tuberosum TaxID=4113 RepID=A0ABQ7W5E3_SOLTU|nr:hypothetical protein KY285_006799 [Solanum tuberosum]KAH0775516.1 hypothetical protein KY290_006927 [Solanum tuberosum]
MMASLVVGNLLRRLEAIPMYKLDTRISEELHDIEKLFSVLLPHVQNAEWYESMNREEEQEQRRSNYRFDICELNSWPWQVAVWAADVEQIFISYSFHMYNNLFNTTTSYMKFLYSSHFKMDSNNVADKIRNCFSILSRSIRASPMIQAFFPIDQTSDEDCVLLLRKVWEVLTSPKMAVLLLNLERTISPQHQQWPVISNLLSNNESTTNQIRMNLESTHIQVKEVKLRGVLAITTFHNNQQIGNFLSNC